MKIMRRISSISIAIVVGLVSMLSLAPVASAQSTSYFGAQTSLSPNTLAGVFTATATSQTSANLPLGGFSEATISLVGTALTTVTFAAQGTNDGVHYFPILLAAIAVPGTTAATETATANQLYVANVSGLTGIRLVTSGTFTATSVLFRVVASTNKGLL